MCSGKLLGKYDLPNLLVERYKINRYRDFYLFELYITEFYFNEDMENFDDGMVWSNFTIIPSDTV